VHAEHTTVYVQGLAEHGRRGLELLHGAVTSPRFDPQVVQREVNQELAAVAQNKLQPAHLAQEAFVPALLGGHAYRGALTLANPDAIRGADPQTLRARAGAILQPQLCTAIIVGTKDEALLAAARGLLGKIPAAASPTEPASLPEPAPAAGGVHRVERPQMGQIYIRLGGLGLEFGDARRAACQVFERAFAGGFTSALVDELRVNRGLVYEAGLSQYWLRTRSPWSLITSTRAEKCGEVLQVVFDQLRAAQQGRLTESQVEAAKNMLLCDIAAGMQTQIGLAHAVWESLHWHGDAEAWRQHLAAIGKVTLADAVAAGRLYDLEQCTIVLVGEQEALQRVAVPKAGR
jgi:zinc protease